MIEITNLTKRYIKNNKIFTALDNVTFKVEKGEFIAIVGPSGSGKSTLLNTIGGLIKPDSGKIFYKDRDIYSLNGDDADHYRREKVGFVFQQFHLVPYLTVIENIKISGNSNHNRSDIQYYLEKCSLDPLKNKYPSELSVGEKQRAAFIRAIISKPEILLADEPTGNLDPENSEIIMSLIKEFHTGGGTVLLVSHMPETARYTDRVITLKAGKIL
jgi:putative ABC transport system ATP-binding protein